ncbi:MAG TPA: DUF1800 domain-containing protein [Gemmatimonadaceae bacterium]|nr:DUF1800 domain-containing protein [Gemmatimonadaceae bacterium]
MSLRSSLVVLTALIGIGCAPAGSSDLVRVPEPAIAAEPREQTADQQVRHVLNRLAFGARPGDVDRVRAMGVDQWITVQLQPARMRDTAAERVVRALPTLSLTSQELLARYPPPQVVRAQMRRSDMSREDSLELRRSAQESRRVLAEMQIGKVARAVASERQLDEVMVDFWENHFTVFAGKGPERYFIAAYDREAIRPHALGKFRDLLGAVAKSPAMLYYLDNWQSSVEEGRPRLDCELRAANCERRRVQGRPTARSSQFEVRSPRRPRGLNENYARELLELHTLGVDGGYTQQDIINVARAFTGWTLEQPRRSGGFIFRPAMHDAGEKVVLGQRLSAGRGMEDGEQVLDIVAAHPSTARFIATKLARRFVSDDPPASLVDRAAEMFRRSDGDIREVVRTIVTSQEFFSSAAYRAKVKSPFELVASALRALNAVPDMTPRSAQVVARLGQPLFLHQAPNGWPERGDAWINTGAILNRINFGLAMAGGAIPSARPERWPRYPELATAPRPAQVDAVIAGLLGGEASVETRGILERGENPLAANCELRAASCELSADSLPDDSDMPRASRNRRDPLARPVNLDGLKEILGLALGAPEFQRR